MSSSPNSLGIRNRIRYHFDNLLSRGTWAALLFLGATTLAVLIISALLLAATGVTLAGSEDSSFREDFWQSMLRVIDPGTMVGDVGWGRRLLSLLVTIFGILIAGTLIGLIASGVEQRVEEMQRGRSVVVESDHVLILGASPRLPVVVNQLTLAGRRRRSNAIVVLADAEPMELRDEVRALVTDTRGSRLVFRSGDPTRRSDLKIVGIERARAIIILADEVSESDAGVVKATLAVHADLEGRKDQIPVICELSDPDNAESLSAACSGRIHAVVPQQGIARITAFALGEPGLNQVMEELLDFRGADIYLLAVDVLEGLTFADSVFRFATAHPIGVLRQDGRVELNPPPETILSGDDRLVVLSDDGRARPGPSTAASSADSTRSSPSPHLDDRRREHLIVVGWNTLGAQVLRQLHQVVRPGSTVEVVYDRRLFSTEDIELPPTDHGLAVTFTPSNVDIWRPPDRAGLSKTTSIMFLGYRRGHSAEAADSRTLLNVMMLKRQFERHGTMRPRLVVELLNADNVELARMTGADDVLVSDTITSRLITQLADQPQRRSVFLSLFGPEGPSLHLMAATDLCAPGEWGWDEIITKAYHHGLLAIGWRRTAGSSSQLSLNPATSLRVVLEPDDHLVVIG